MDSKTIFVLAMTAFFSIQAICKCIVKLYRAKHGIDDSDNDMFF